MITRGIFRKLLLSSLTVLSCLVYRCTGQVSQFDLPGQPLIDYPGLQVDSEGRAFVAAGNQLLRLGSDLVVEQNVSLAYRAVNISISPEGERLMVCKADLSCVVYNTSDLTVEPIGAGIVLLSTDSVAIISIEGSFYVGSYVLGMGSILRGTIRLSQYIYGDGTSSVIRQTDYVVGTSSFTRNFLSGFESGGFVYFIVYDPNTEEQVLWVMRVCHATGCPGNNTSCGFTALYEEDIKCGGTAARLGDGACGVSVVKDFGGTSGTSMILSRCRQDSTFSNVVCSFNLSSVDTNMDMRLDGCKNETILDIEVAWVGVPFLCSSLAVSNITLHGFEENFCCDILKQFVGQNHKNIHWAGGSLEGISEKWRRGEQGGWGHQGRREEGGSKDFRSIPQHFILHIFYMLLVCTFSNALLNVSILSEHPATLGY